MLVYKHFQKFPTFVQSFSIYFLINIRQSVTILMIQQWNHLVVAISARRDHKRNGIAYDKRTMN